MSELAELIEKRFDGRGQRIDLISWNWKNSEQQWGIAISRTRNDGKHRDHVQFTFDTYNQARAAYHALLTAC